MNQNVLGSNGRPMTSTLQEATIMFIVDGLNSADLNAAKEAFTLIDTDRDGKLTKEGQKTKKKKSMICSTNT